MPDDFATTEDIAAVRPDVPLQTIRHHIRQGGPWFPGARQVGRTWVVPLAEAENYCANYQRYARGAGDPLDAPAPTSPEESCA